MCCVLHRPLGGDTDHQLRLRGKRLKRTFGLENQLGFDQRRNFMTPVSRLVTLSSDS